MKTIDVETATQLVRDVATQHVVDAIESSVFDAGLAGGDFDAAVAVRLNACRQTIELQVDAVRAWLISGTDAPLRFNSDGSVM